MHWCMVFPLYSHVSWQRMPQSVMRWHVSEASSSAGGGGGGGDDVYTSPSTEPPHDLAFGAQYAQAGDELSWEPSIMHHSARPRCVVQPRYTTPRNCHRPRHISPEVVILGQGFTSSAQPGAHMPHPSCQSPDMAVTHQSAPGTADAFTVQPE